MSKIAAEQNQIKQANDFFVLDENQNLPADISKSKDEIDPITKSIRDNVLDKQLLLLNNWLQDNSQTEPAISPELKKKFEDAEIQGYRNVLNNPEIKIKLQNLSWDNEQNDAKSKVVKNAAGEEICTLTETTKKIAFAAVNDQGENIKIDRYRSIDFPKQLSANGPMHLALAVKDKNGHNIAEDKAVYFTAHYDKAGKLTELSAPQPIKFMGKNEDAIGYIEHQGEIYTLPVTQGKYQEMIKEVAKNNGKATDLSQEIEIKEKPLASDKIIVMEAESAKAEVNVEQKREFDNKSKSLVESIKEEALQEAPKKENLIDKLKNISKKIQNSAIRLKSKIINNQKINEDQAKSEQVDNSPVAQDESMKVNINPDRKSTSNDGSLPNPNNDPEKIQKFVEERRAIIEQKKNANNKIVINSEQTDTSVNKKESRPTMSDFKKNLNSNVDKTVFEGLPPLPKQLPDHETNKVSGTRLRSSSESSKPKPNSEPITSSKNKIIEQDVMPQNNNLSRSLNNKTMQKVNEVKHDLQTATSEKSTRPRSQSMSSIRPNKKGQGI